MTTRAEFTWNDSMALGDFVTRFMETVTPHGEYGALRITGIVNGQEMELLLSIELLGVKGQTS